MTDITERLRQNARSEDCFNDPYPDVLIDAANEIDRLREKWADAEARSVTLATVQRERDELRARVAELEKDAERYRWLRHGDNDDEVIRGDTYGLAFLPRNAALDAAIDAAMAKDGA